MSTKEFRYPIRKLESSDDYFQIKVVKYTAPGVTTGFRQPTSDAISRATPLYIINLPIPKGISDSNGVTWGEDSLNSIAAYGLSASNEIIESENFGKEVMNQVSKAIGVAGDSFTGGNLQELIQQKFAAMAVGSLGGNVSLESILSRTSGQTLNPNMELLFQGVKLRSFNFSYDMAPRDSNEAIAVKTILRIFKASMAAKKSSTSGASDGLFISSPDVFLLEYKKGSSKHPFLPTFKPTALVNMTVDYTASGMYATYSDGTPVHVNLNLSFQELNPIYFEDYSSSEASTGVGY